MKCPIAVNLLAGILAGASALSAAEVPPATMTAPKSTALERAISEVRAQFRGESDAWMAGDIRSFVTVRTNLAQGTVNTLEEFTRHGQTNLIRVTVMQHGVLQHRGHNFYHRGMLVGRYIWGNGHTIINAGMGTPYTLTLVLNESNQPFAATIQGTNRSLDLFLCTNGVFYPELMQRSRESK